MGRSSLPDSNRQSDQSRQEPASQDLLANPRSLATNAITEPNTKWIAIASVVITLSGAVIALLVLLFGTNLSGQFSPAENQNIPQAALAKPAQDQPGSNSDQSTTEQQRFYSRYSFSRAPFVHPRIIGDLIGWISDTGDQVVAINLLDSQQSNRYHGEIAVRRVDNQADSPWPWVFWFDGVDNGEYGYGRTPFISYQYLGTT